MSQNVIVIGASKFSSLIRLYLEQNGMYKVVAYAVEEKYATSDTWDELPLVHFESLREYYPPNEYSLVNTLGYTNMLGVRERIQHQGCRGGYKFVTYIHPSAVVNSRLGEGCIVLEQCSIGFRNKIGDGCIFWMGSTIAHDCNIGSYCYWAPRATCCGNVEVGKRCFIGAGAILRNRIQVVEKCLIGAGVYLNKSLDEAGAVLRAPYPQKHPLISTDIF